jgi:peptidoglycan/xylan/chitin deacetylase (PgdA/CDA1 family)
VPQIASLGFHEVTDQPRETGFQRPGAVPFTLTPRAFASCLDLIAAGPMAPSLVRGLRWDDPGPHLLLTFDDGGRSALHAADELSRRGWRGHFFIVTGRIGTRTFLDRSEIRYLHDCGHVIGSHSHTHPNIFREQPEDRMREEWRTSADILSDLIGVPCETAAVPGGDISPQVLRLADEAGFQVLFTVEPELRPRRVGSCRVLGRCLIKSSMTPERVAELARAQGWERALLLRRLKVLARRAVPLLYRQFVRQRTREWEVENA